MAQDNLHSLRQSQADTRKMLAQWRENSFHEIELPLSQRVLKVRDVGIIDLALEGKIPNTMMDLVQQLNDGKVKEADMMTEHAVEFGALINMIFVSSVIYPPIAEEGDEDHIGINEFVYGDKMALFNWVNREAVIVRPFRKESSEAMADISNGKNVQQTPQ